MNVLLRAIGILKQPLGLVLPGESQPVKEHFNPLSAIKELEEMIIGDGLKKRGILFINSVSSELVEDPLKDGYDSFTLLDGG